MKKKIILFIFFGGILYSCTQSLYMPSVSDAVVQEKLMAGRKLYVDHCSGCHNLHFPQEFSVEQWGLQLEEMQVKAKISDEQKRLILQYLTSQPSNGKRVPGYQRTRICINKKINISLPAFSL